MISAGCYGLDPKLHFPDGNSNVEKPKPTLPRVEGGMGGHINQWVTGWIEGGETSSPFSYAGPLSEDVLMGNLGIRSYQMEVLQGGNTASYLLPYTNTG